MKLNQVAAQLYTVRDFCQTPPDIAASLKKIAGIGYRAVQVSGIGPIPEEELVRICRDEGLTICATHEPGDKILNDPPWVIERLNKLGCRLTAYPYPGGVNFDTLDGVKALAAGLNTAGRALSAAGITLAYHNHHIEFRRLAGKPVLEHIYELTDPRFVRAELDTYWVQAGGGNPIAWCQKMNGRLPQLHLKDYGIAAPDNKVIMAEIGAGNLDWPGIIAAADAAGCQWFIVEQDTCPGSPFDSLKQSFVFIRDHLTS